MKLIKLYDSEMFLEKERRLQYSPYSKSLSVMLINLAVIKTEQGAKELKLEKSIYECNYGLIVD
ncbi:hypothetical protein K2V14_003769 [Vibrio vulnificus]|nr:hypothetical protein [Vibrio vulnificus]EHY1122776.1 hypothetical protein [Vibrio vulnificus]